MLIKSTQEMRAFLGRAISSDFTFDSLKPYLELAQQDYLVKALGAEYWAVLETQAQNNEANPILPLVSRALAFYAYHKYLPYSIGLDSDTGLQETESDNTKPLRIGVLEKRQRETIENASNALEAVLLELFKNKTNYQAFGIVLSVYRSKVFGFLRLHTLPKYCPWWVVRIGCSLVSIATLPGLKYPRLYLWLVSQLWHKSNRRISTTPPMRY
jgi:hypothetical protein